MIRRVRFPFDKRLYREAYSWQEDKPEWFRELERESFLSFVGRGIDVGVWDNDFIGLLQLEETQKDIFEIHLSAKRGANLELIKIACESLKSILELGARELYVWALRKNQAVIKLCESCGMRKDGATMLKGKAFNRPLEWVRLIYTREMYGREKTNTDTNVCVSDSA